MATVEVSGLKELFAKMKEWRSEVWQRVEDALAHVAQSIAATAKARAPAYTGNLKDQITARYPRERKGARAPKYVHYVVSSSPEGHLVEFGTGRQYEKPAGIQLARESRASGKHPGLFTVKAQQRLIDWARARGAADPVAAAGAIAAALDKDGGVRPKPYLFPALLQHQDELINELTKAIQGAIEEVNVA